MLPSPSLMYPAKGLRPSLRAWRSNERNSFLARLSIGTLDQFGLGFVELGRVERDGRLLLHGRSDGPNEALWSSARGRWKLR